MITNSQSNGGGGTIGTQGGGPAAKWAILLDDELFPVPRSKLEARDILEECGVTRDCVLKRDHGGTHGLIFADNDQVDLAQGNVFCRTPRCDVTREQRPD